MKKFISLLIGCSLALAGAAMAQQPEAQQTPTKKKPAAAKTNAAEAQPGAHAAKPHEAAVQEPGATTEPGAGKGRKARASQESATGAQTGTTETGVSGQPAGTPTHERAAAKGRKGTASPESATGAQTGTTETGASGQPAGGATQPAEQGTKGRKGRGAKAMTSATPAAPAAAAVSATPATTPAAATGAVSATPAAATASAAPTAAAAGQPTTQTNVAGGTKKADPQKVQQVKQQAQQIKQQHANFRAQPKPQQVPAVTFNPSYRVQGSDRWQGSQYEVFRSYRPERHDSGWYRSRYGRVELIGGGYYYFNSGYWYPAWGYDSSAEYYAYDAPIYVGQRAQPPDQVIADVQAALQQMGYYQGEVDGLLGPLTRQALTAYQADQGLVATAVIDQPTLDSLGLS